MQTPLKGLAIATVLALASTGCFELSRKSTLTAPSELQSLSILLGSWSSASVMPSADSCTDFQWNVTEQSGSSASGIFRATCPGGLTLAGTAQGTMLGSTVSWTANGNATASGLPSCAFTLAGTAHIDGNTIRVPYSGQTCLGPVKGEEVLHKR